MHVWPLGETVSRANMPVVKALILWDLCCSVIISPQCCCGKNDKGPRLATCLLRFSLLFETYCWWEDFFALWCYSLFLNYFKCLLTLHLFKQLQFFDHQTTVNQIFTLHFQDWLRYAVVVFVVIFSSEMYFRNCWQSEDAILIVELMMDIFNKF